MLKAVAAFLSQFGGLTAGSTAAVEGAIEGASAAIKQSFGFDSSLGQIAVSSVGNVG